LVAELLTRHLDEAGAQVDFPQQASRCVASGWGVHLLRRPYLVAGLLERQLDGAGELVDFPQQASRCAASGWEVHVGRSQSVDSAGAYLARETTPCLALQRRRDTGEWRMSHRWQPRYSAPRGARVCLGLSGTGGARHVVSLRASELSSGSQGPPILPLPHEKCHEPPGGVLPPCERHRFLGLNGARLMITFYS
jgi:hypothetical protein